MSNDSFGCGLLGSLLGQVADHLLANRRISKLDRVVHGVSGLEEIADGVKTALQSARIVGQSLVALFEVQSIVQRAKLFVGKSHNAARLSLDKRLVRFLGIVSGALLGNPPLADTP